MRIECLRFAGFVVSFSAALAFVHGAVLDLQTGPGEAERKHYLEAGWKPGAEQLRADLMAAYSAAAVSERGFEDWLALYDWLEVLGREGTEDLARLVRLHLWTVPGGERPTIMPPGANRPPAEGAENVTLEQARRLVAGDKFNTELASRFVPAWGRIPEGPIGDALGADAVATLVADMSLGRELFQNLAEGDLLSVGLPLLLEFRAAAGERWADYTRLAVALALVYDRPPPGFWPHHQVDPKIVPRQNTTPAERFGFWMRNNEERKFLLDLKNLTVEQAKFVVDAFVPDEELLWAQNNVKQGRGSFDRAFFMIRYDKQRYNDKKYDWQGKGYRLVDIEKEGGICVDQAYFAMMAGKAHGLPTLFFSGQGASGGHGWFGYMRSDDKWEVDCGRYEGQNYSVGVALDPQTWDRISDHELVYLASRFRDKPEFLKSQLHLRMARLFERAGDTAGRGAAIANALAACPENVAAWDARTALLEGDPQAAAELKAHAEAAAQKFATNDDIKVRYQKILAAVMRKLGDTAGAEQVERRIISQQKDERADLTVDTASGRLQELIDAKNHDEAYKEFKKLIRKLGDSGGGNAFQGIVMPFVESLIAAGEHKLAEKALKEARDELKPERGSLLEDAFGKLEEKAGVRSK